MGTAEELAFLLQESGTALVDASDVLHVVDKSLAEKNRFMPRGMTEADGWMAKHGNPLSSTETAMKVAYMVGNLFTCTMAIKPDRAEAVVRYGTAKDNYAGLAFAETLPIAICAAVMDAIDKKGKANV